MSQRILATFNLYGSGGTELVGQTQVLEYFDENGRPTLGLQVESDLKHGEIRTWAWSGPAGSTYAMASAVSSVGWGGIVDPGTLTAARDYRKVSMI